jgi:N,N'-diacetyllegionaminate synthase
MSNIQEKCIPIADKLVGPGQPVFIIAEAGVNHNGDLDLARQLVLAARDAGADAVKFQTFKTELLVTKDLQMAQYQARNTGSAESQYDMLKRLELSESAHTELLQLCEKVGIIFLSTPFDLSSAKLLERIGVPAFKIGSSDADNIPFLLQLARTGKPLILSSGMSDLTELKNSVKRLQSINQQLIVLQCTTEYPCPPDQVNLRAMQTLRDSLGTLVGFSDHTQGATAAVLATVLGATVIEKHLTLDRKLPGPDHLASSEPQEFEELVRQVRAVSALTAEQRRLHIGQLPQAEAYLGSPNKQLAESVIASGVSKIAKKSIITACKISKGALITEEMLEVKRPGTGIRPGEFWNVLGKRTLRDLEPEHVLQWEDLGET